MKITSEYTEFSKPSKDATMKLLRKLLALLRAQHLFYYNCHWEAQGDSFYELHLLFERLYAALPNQFDGLAEKMVAFFGKEATDLNELMPLMADWLESWRGDDKIQASLKSEDDLQTNVVKIYNQLKESDELTLGLDDFLMALADDHETHQYLLKRFKE